MWPDDDDLMLIVAMVAANWQEPLPMCNLYNSKSNREAILALARGMADRSGWNEPSLQVYPNYRAPVVRSAPDGTRESWQCSIGNADAAAVCEGQRRSWCDEHQQGQLPAAAARVQAPAVPPYFSERLHSHGRTRQPSPTPPPRSCRPAPRPLQ